MVFQVGDQVVHRSHGLGEVVQLDEKILNGDVKQCYVVQIGELMLWVPIGEFSEINLRYPTPAGEFDALFAILSGPAELLSAERNERRLQVSQRLREGNLDAICRVVRDLTFFSRTKKMNDNDASQLERAQNSLLQEWALSLSISIPQAKLELKKLLGG